MKKDVIISIKSSQRSDDDVNDIEFMTEGKYYKKGNDYYIMYEETEMTGVEGTKTTIKFTDDSVTLTRFDSISSHMVFEEEKKHVSVYTTEYGSFAVGVLTNHLDVSLNDNGGNVEVNYSVEISDKPTSVNNLTMNVREAGN